MNRQHAALLKAMTQYNKGDTARIQHFWKVHNLAAVIGVLEGLDEETLFILETAAIVHDIGIRESLRKNGVYAGHYHEVEGEIESEKLLREMGGYTEEQIARVKYLVGHHHTYGNIDGLDYQILLEADFLVNLYEHEAKYSAIMAAQKNMFRTDTGLALLRDMYEKQYQA